MHRLDEFHAEIHYLHDTIIQWGRAFCMDVFSVFHPEMICLGQEWEHVHSHKEKTDTERKVYSYNVNCVIYKQSTSNTFLRRDLRQLTCFREHKVVQSRLTSWKKSSSTCFLKIVFFHTAPAIFLYVPRHNIFPSDSSPSCTVFTFVLLGQSIRCWHFDLSSSHKHVGSVIHMRSGKLVGKLLVVVVSCVEDCGRWLGTMSKAWWISRDCWSNATRYEFGGEQLRVVLLNAPSAFKSGLYFWPQ